MRSGPRWNSIRGMAVPTTLSSPTFGLGFLGIRLDPGWNQATADAEIGDPGAPVRTLVITAREDIEVARQARMALLGAS